VRSVARRLGIADATVKVHLYRAYKKLGVTSMGQAARIVYGEQAPPAV
jgi:DNA-binding NarL/FixJ family response regulator